MSRYIAIPALAMLVTGFVVASGLSPTPPGRTLDGESLWLIQGGQQQPDKCCDLIDYCYADEVCEDAQDWAACLDLSNKETENPPNSNLNGCNFTDLEMTQCTEATTTNVCILWYTCTWDSQANTCKRYQLVDTRDAPSSCWDEGC